MKKFHYLRDNNIEIVIEGTDMQVDEEIATISSNGRVIFVVNLRPGDCIYRVNTEAA